MGPALPYAVAAKFAYPSRPVVATVGDGAMQMNGINVLVTIQKYWKEWSNKQLVMLVLNNRDLNMVTWEQRVLAGDPKYDAAQVLPDFRYADYARSLGLGGLRVEKPADIAGAIEQAMVADRPFVLECLTDPEVPPLPPHITFEQAVKFWKSATKGKPETWHMLKQSVKEITAKVIPYGSSSS
jgi:pyruvate dehydrogenase (quinone)